MFLCCCCHHHVYLFLIIVGVLHFFFFFSWLRIRISCVCVCVYVCVRACVHVCVNHEVLGLFSFLNGVLESVWSLLLQNTYWCVCNVWQDQILCQCFNRWLRHDNLTTWLWPLKLCMWNKPGSSPRNKGTVPSARFMAFPLTSKVIHVCDSFILMWNVWFAGHWRLNSQLRSR